MRNRRQILLIFAGCCLFLAAVTVSLTQPREPQYQGRPLRYWLALYSEYDPEHRYAGDPALELLNNNNAEDALRSCGPVALPWLVTWISHAPPAWECPLLAKVQKYLPSSWGEWFQGRYERMAADNHAGRSGFQILKEAASPAIPELGRVAVTARDQWRGSEAMYALALIGHQSLPTLMSVATNPAAPCRYSAIWCLGHFGTNSLPALPMLLDYLGGPDDKLAMNAAAALGHLGVAPEVVVPALSQALHSSHPEQRVAAAWALANVGEASVPILRAALEDPILDVRKVMTNALANALKMITLTTPTNATPY